MSDTCFVEDGNLNRMSCCSNPNRIARILHTVALFQFVFIAMFSNRLVEPSRHGTDQTTSRD